MSLPEYSKRDRDPDLIESDEILDNETLDGLWGWFNKALDAEFDRELIFVKMVNSVSYLDDFWCLYLLEPIDLLYLSV